jgi:hypothetical protein
MRIASALGTASFATQNINSHGTSRPMKLNQDANSICNMNAVKIGTVSATRTAHVLARALPAPWFHAFLF